MDLAAEIAANRDLTSQFIMSDPVAIVLTPSGELRTPGGGVAVSNGTPRAPQTFRLIPMDHREQRQVSVSEGGGTQRRYSFTLLGEWNSAMEPGDHWQDLEGNHWRIVEMVPDNGYQRKGLVRAYGESV